MLLFGPLIYMAYEMTITPTNLFCNIVIENLLSDIYIYHSFFIILYSSKKLIAIPSSMETTIGRNLYGTLADFSYRQSHTLNNFFMNNKLYD